MTLFVNNTGLMWELGKAVGAMLLFAEHRYYGKSLPAASGDCLRFLTVNQALSDYANLMIHVRTQYALPQSTPVITFGSSYGGMLSAWMRMKYPHLVEGAIASSAPIFHAFGSSPSPDPAAYARRVSAAMGPTCSAKVKSVLKVVDRWSRNQIDRSQMAKTLRFCKDTDTDSETVLRWATIPWGFFAMGNYPFPNAYIPTTAGIATHDIPANPLDSACAILLKSSDESDVGLLISLRDSLQFWYNNIGESKPCFSTKVAEPLAHHSHEKCYGDYSFQRCAELGGPYQQGTKGDAFWPPKSVGETELRANCIERYGRDARVQTGTVEFGLGSVRDTVASMSNIVWSNGEYDPWGEYGVDCKHVDCPPSVLSPFIEGGAHSSDLMFSNPLDSAQLIEVRRMEYAQISSWIEARILRYSGVRSQNTRPSGKLPSVHVVPAQ